MKKVLALVLALLMLVALFAACKDKNDPNKNDPQKDPNNSGTDELVVRNFGGADYTILVNEYTNYQFNGARNGNMVEFAVAERQEEVEETYGVNVNILSIKGGWGERNSFTNAVRAEKTSQGTDGINLVVTHSVYLGWMCIEGLAQDMSKYSDYIHLNKDWWNQELYDALNLKGHVFMMIGDIAYTLYEYINVMFVNNTAFEEYFHDQGGTEMLYQLVEDGEWTWEKLWDFASDFGTGAMGDGKYGIATNTHAYRAIPVSMDLSLFDKDASGKLSLPNALKPEISKALRTMTEMYAKDNLDIVEDYNGNYASVYTPMFIAGNILFYPQTLDEAIKIFQANQDDFGIVPLPKLDTMQDMYKTQCRDTVNAVMIINSATNDPKGKNEGEMAAIVTEGMAYYGREIVTPAYYERQLTDRYLSRYEDILTEIRKGLTYVATDSYISDKSDKNGAGTMRWDKFLRIVTGASASVADTSYASDVNKGRTQLSDLYFKLKSLGVNFD